MVERSFPFYTDRYDRGSTLPVSTGYLCGAMRYLLPFLFLFSRLSAQPEVELQPVTTGLGFLVDISHAGDDRLFCLTQNGIIRIVLNGVVLPQPFMDLSAQVWGSGELGSLGLAFDPDFENTGHFYVHYTALTDQVYTRISRFQVSSDPNVGDLSSEQILWTYPHPSNIHKGGDLKFGPDGMLYFSLGDGAFPVNGQDLTEPLASILRIDVSGDSAGFAIPPDNPFANSIDTVQEVWAYGLRNPWRMSFDRLTGDLWFGDVGAQQWEEIDLIEAGSGGGWNFGWRCFEGLAPIPDATDCGAITDHEQPVIVHPHTEGWCAIIGGRVYRGETYPQLYGRYLYTDLCAGVIRSLLPDGSGGWLPEQLASDLPFGLTCIGEDHEGELYIGHQGGTLYRLDASITTGLEDRHSQNIMIHPNPAADHVIITGQLSEGSKLTITDMAGRLLDQRILGSVENDPVFDLRSLATGTYVFIVEDRRGRRVLQHMIMVER